MLFFCGMQSVLRGQNSPVLDINSIINLDLDNLSETETYALDSIVQVHQHDLADSRKSQFLVGLVDALMEYDSYQLALARADSAIPLLLAGEKPGILAELYATKSLIHDNLGQYAEALLASQNSLKLYLEVEDKEGEAHCYNDIGVLHYYRGDQILSQEYLNKGLAIFQDLNDTLGVSLYYCNMGNSVFEDGDYERALKMYKKGLEFDLLLHDLEGESITLSNIGETYIYTKEYDKAEEALIRSLAAAEESGDTWTISNPLRGLGELYQLQGRTDDAIAIIKRSVELSKKIDALPELSEAYDLLYRLYKEVGSSDSSLLYLELHKAANDSIFNQSSERLIGEMEMKYQIKDKAKEIQLVNTARNLEDLKHQKEMALLWAGLGGFCLILLLMIRGFLLNKKANRKLTEQNTLINEKNEQLQYAYHEIEDKSNEILDSIRYAKRIQSAILPPAALVNEYLKNSFVIYKPKDVVAGDFYWLEQKEGKVLFAAADCTGHGVPGAMVSVICNNGLNRSVHEYGLMEPGKILDKTREIVIKAFERSEDDLRDGMDIALCSIEGNTLEYAGANNPLWLVRNGEILETKANKQPIGKFRDPMPYTTHTIDLQQGDTIYLFSDGYIDQFGGTRGKKLKARAFRDILISVQDKTMQEQKRIIDSTFEQWKGSLEQIDDVCIIGVRVQ